ncbi:MAG: YkgJ family cysteine cluster protein [Thermodesulfovibrionales bacterium]|nr:YkgJ family cysteine cluster protein [Thermodesulfovibrionales bacterium]
MKDKKLKKAGSSKQKRLSFPSDENKHLWLPFLLDAYFIVYKGIDEAVRTAFKKGRKLACSKGCSNCCKTHQTIPVYPLELVGLSWYVTEKITGPERDIIKTQLRNYKENDPCPFLVNSACSVHPMRPVSCRQFNVFGTPCAEGEDPYYTRREDVLSPIKQYTDRAFFIMLPFYGVEDENERWRIIESGAVHQVVKLMQTCNWKSLADKMDEFERQIAENK